MNEFLRKNTLVYGCLGIWPNSGSSKFFEKLRHAWAIFLLICMAIRSALLYVELFAQLQLGRNWDCVLENAPISILCMVVSVKFYVAYTRREELVSLSNEIDSYVNELFQEKNNEKITILQGYQRTVQRINNCLWITIALSLIFMHISTISTIFLARDHSLRPMLVPIYIPISVNSTGNYAVVFSLDVIIGCLTAVHAITFDLFFIGCIIFAIARLKILQYSIQRVGAVVWKEMENSPRKYSFISGTLEGVFQKNFGTEMRKSIQEHERIIVLCKSIDSILSFPLFLVFLSYSISICFLGLYAMRLGPSLDLLKIGQILLVTLSQIFLYFWYGNELTTESLEVGNSALKNDWHNVGKRNVTTIMFVAFRSQKPIYLSVGKFNTVSLQTLLSLLSTSYSYFALLNQLSE